MLDGERKNRFFGMDGGGELVTEYQIHDIVRFFYKEQVGVCLIFLPLTIQLSALKCLSRQIFLVKLLVGNAYSSCRNVSILVDHAQIRIKELLTIFLPRSVVKHY